MLMPGRPKSQIVAFKVEEKLAEFLNQLPNKSLFIRKAIVAQLGMACPLCRGSGVTLPGLHDHYAQVLTTNNKRPCDACGQKMVITANLEQLPEEERPRIAQFLHGGPFYCANCYTKTAACTDCGWHLTLERLADHIRFAHVDKQK
jgi:hypothetical protein